MDLCLYDQQYGYYNLPNLEIGTKGDFFTSTTISADFAQLLAIQLKQFWEVLGKPKPFYLIEMGAGNGNLAFDILQFLVEISPEFVSNLKYIIIEKSLSLRQKQQEYLQEKLQLEKFDLSWCSLDDLSSESIVGCFFSNELIDAMPVHLITWQNQKIKEIYLTYQDGKIQEQVGDLSTSNLLDYLSLTEITFSDIYPQDYRTEINLQALDWLKTVANKLKQGYILTIDYGYIANKYYHPQRNQGTLTCYFKHRYHDNFYVNIGNQDLSAHVNFTALQNYGKSLNLLNVGYIQQALFLMNLGLGDRLNQLSHNDIPLTEILFKRNQLHSLINPQGLGNFKILLQSKNIDYQPQSPILQGFKNNTDYI